VIESSAEESTKGRAEGDLNSTGKKERERVKVRNSQRNAIIVLIITLFLQDKPMVTATRFYSAM